MPYNPNLDPSNLNTVDQQLKQLQEALQSGQIDYNTYQQMFQQFAPQASQNINQWAAGGSSSADAAKRAGLTDFNTRYAQGGTNLETFANQLKNLTGQAPTAQDIQGFMSTMGTQVTPQTSYADVNALVNQYIQNKYGSQIQQNQQQQQTQQLGTAQQSIQDIINKQNQSTLDYLKNPQTMAQLEGAYNNRGLLDSGAFSAGLGNTLAQGATQNESNALGQFGIPAISNIFGTAGQPYQNFLGNLNANTQQAGQTQNSLTNFDMQKNLAEQLGAMQQPSKLQQWAPVIQGGLAAGGQIEGGRMAAGRPTYLCTHLKNLGLMTEEEVNQVHQKLYPRFIFHPIDLIKYAFFAPAFIIKADEICFDWKGIKPFLCEKVLQEETCEKAFQRYKEVCKRIFSGVLVYGQL